jgi:hypothetical protein
MSWRSRAESVAQMYMPMFVGEVYAARVSGSSAPPMLSDGRPVSGLVIATNPAHVSAAQRWSVALEFAALTGIAITRASSAARGTARRRCDRVIGGNLLVA